MCLSNQGVCTDSVAMTRKLQNGETVQMIRGSEQDGRHRVADRQHGDQGHEAPLAVNNKLKRSQQHFRSARAPSGQKI